MTQLVSMDSLAFLVSYDASIFTLALNLSPLQPKNRKLRAFVSKTAIKILHINIIFHFHCVHFLYNTISTKYSLIFRILTL